MAAAIRNANAAHPFENPTPLSNFIQMLSIFAIRSGLTYYLGRMVKNQGHGWAVWAAMIAAVPRRACWSAGGRKRRAIRFISSSASPPPMATWKARKSASASSIPRSSPPITTDASCGAVNSMHDSFTALGGLVPLFNIQLGEVVFGGVGAGLYGMLVFVVLAVFIAGLMVGRTPEYLGKKIERVRCEDGDAVAARSGAFHPRLHRLGRRQQMGTWPD